MSHAHAVQRRLVLLTAPGVLALVLSAGCQREQPATETERIASPAVVQSDFVDELVVSGLTDPTAMAFTPDGRLFVTELGGKVRVIKAGALLSTPFTTISVNTTSTAGE